MVDTGQCWLYAGYKTPKGYGEIFHGSESYRAHRVTYENAKGAIPVGYEIDHLCRTPTCINPEHLEAVTPNENKRRSIHISVRLKLCTRGHEFTDANTHFYINRRGRTIRSCLACTVLRRKGLHK